MYLIKSGALVTLYGQGCDEGPVILAEYLPIEPETSVRRARVIQGGRDRVVDLVWYTLVPLDEADICEI